MIPPRYRTALSCALALLLSPLLVQAERHHDALQYVADDVAAIAYVDMPRVDTDAFFAVLDQSGDLSKSDLEMTRQSLAALQGIVNPLVQAGAGRAYALLRSSDVVHGGPSWVLPTREGDNPQKIAAALQQLLPKANGNQRPPLWPTELAVAEDCVLAAMNSEQLSALVKSHRGPTSYRADAQEALSGLGDHHIGLVVFGDVAGRRVVREMFPPLPSPFEKINGQLIADKLHWVAASIDLPPSRPRARVVVQARDESTAKTVDGTIRKALEMGKAMLTQQRIRSADSVPAEVVQAVDKLSPQMVGTRVSVALDDFDELTVVGKMLSPPLATARQSAQRQQRMSQFKMIGLSMWVYERTHKSFPPRAITDAHGRPLLSWRVAVLPHLEAQGAQSLYGQFHLDEPWDSEHNRKLVAKMPEVYADPDARVRHAAGDGRTTFVVPAGDSTVFHGPEGTKAKEITDGTSKTILVVEVIPERAVIWTKPEDWTVDLEHPLDGVRRDDGRPFVAAYCDGSVRVIDPTMKDEDWSAALTRAGRETTER